MSLYARHAADQKSECCRRQKPRSMDHAMDRIAAVLPPWARPRLDSVLRSLSRRAGRTRERPADNGVPAAAAPSDASVTATPPPPPPPPPSLAPPPADATPPSVEEAPAGIGSPDSVFQHVTPGEWAPHRTAAAAFHDEGDEAAHAAKRHRRSHCSERDWRMNGCSKRSCRRARCGSAPRVALRLTEHAMAEARQLREGAERDVGDAAIGGA